MFLRVIQCLLPKGQWGVTPVKQDVAIVLAHSPAAGLWAVSSPLCGQWLAQEHWLTALGQHGLAGVNTSSGLSPVTCDRHWDDETGHEWRPHGPPSVAPRGESAALPSPCWLPAALRGWRSSDPCPFEFLPLIPWVSPVPWVGVVVPCVTAKLLCT